MLSRARDDDLESEQAGDLYQHFLREGIIFVRGAIDEKLSNAVIAQLLYADQEAGEEPLSVYVNSSGGDLRAALAIYDTMQLVRREIKTVCVGVAAGPAVLLLAAGSKGDRYANPHARIGLQRPQASLSGTTAEIDVHARELLKLSQQFNELLARHSEQPLERIEHDADQDLWLGAEEAKAYGIIDTILGPNERP